MRLQFISEGSQDTPLILITCNRAQAVAAFSAALLRTSSGPVELHRLPGVEAVDGLSLVAHATLRDLGVRKGAGSRFDWFLSQSGWEEVAGLLEPFAEPNRTTDGLQFLNRHGGPNAIISTNGRW
ncbi:hypothetical protein [Anaeromyxobacter terrae]|uniref:hypothetical protein n=1 Tax=Anaeromyxobacter terrae TaxID=2925406 RepID=UPI001F57720D|nr:hypothetical protein [Anaeromyxobacter sp. SG22]